MKIFRVGSQQFRESLRELLRELRFSHCSSREMPFREWDFSFRELFSELRELLREYPGTLPELQEWPLHSESVFLEIGVVPGLLIKKSFTSFERSQQKNSAPVHILESLCGSFLLKEATSAHSGTTGCYRKS